MEAEELRQLFDEAPQPLWVFDVDTLRFLAVNQTAVRLYGYTKEEFLSMRITDIRPAEDVVRLQARVELLRNRTDQGSVWRHLKKDGALLYVEINSRPLVFRGRDARIVLARDVTQYYLHERELVEQSLCDPLTGCRNRRYLEQYAGAVGAGDRWGCIMLDVDGLKHVNDSHGHAHGDEALIAVARALMYHTREDDVVVRMGGDEFLLLLKKADEETVRDIAARLAATSADLPASFSLGYAARLGEESIYDTLRRADEELYRTRAKNKAKAAESNGQPISSPES